MMTMKMICPGEDPPGVRELGDENLGEEMHRGR